MKKKETIVMTGFMGSGKSAVGREIAKRLQLPFRDLDEEIEKGERTKISTIFETKGEEHFRKLEQEYFDKTIAISPLVMALGGGAIQQKPVADFIRTHAIMVCLDVPEETLFKRLKKDKKRPLLRNSEGKLLDDRQLHGRISELMVLRKPLYSLADITVSVKPFWSINDTTNELVRRLSEYDPASVS